MQHEFAIAETSDVAYEISQKTDADASAGLELIENTIETMTSLSEQMVQASQGVFDLNAQSEQVSALVSGIQGIAEQTNLLALNAAIEAARAGEQGRGFAVVADEVRKLALRTSEATREIIDVVGRNRQLTEQAVSLIEQSLEKVSEAGELSQKAGKAMAEMQAGAQEVVTTVSSLKSRL
ncbi:methyl-accepting chemotaxis protein [Oceanospirillum sp.]|uniref:methyl-accepting chemotaxis protein n=1 Tax=Oceanospirillum sp. TaxID=2021254 RepID=UPI003A8F9E61